MWDLSSSPPSGDEASLLAIGVCTFRRPALERTLQSLAEQSLPGATRCCVIVADNDDQPSAATIASRADRAEGWPVHYVHAPARNISVARNALLEKAQALEATYLAMIDDDEVADSGWAEALLVRMRETAADAVLGKVLAVYREHAVEWMRAARLHDTLPVIRRDGRILTGYAGNVLLRLDSPFVRGRRFNPAYGVSGGEDDEYFHGIARDGGQIAFASGAVAREEVPEERESLRFLVRRSFRAGQTYGSINARPGRAARMVSFTKAAAKFGVLLGYAGLVCFSPALRGRALVRASLHAGVCAHLLGGRTFELYK